MSLHKYMFVLVFVSISFMSNASLAQLSIEKIGYSLKISIKTPLIDDLASLIPDIGRAIPLLVARIAAEGTAPDIGIPNLEERWQGDQRTGRTFEQIIEYPTFFYRVRTLELTPEEWGANILEILTRDEELVEAPQDLHTRLWEHLRPVARLLLAPLILRLRMIGAASRK